MKPAQPFISSRLSWLLRGLGLLLVLTVTVTIATNRSRMDDFETLGYLGAFLAMLASNATLVLPAPGVFVVFALGGSLNPLLVGLVAGLGATLGEMSGYITGFSGLAVLEHTAIAQRIENWMQRNGTLTILLLSAFPNPFFDVGGVLAGASRMPLYRFLGAAIIGKTFQALVISYAGAYSLDWLEPWLIH